LITEEGKEAKKAKRAESRELNKERKEKVVKKLGAYFSFNQLNKEFNSGELDRLLESEVIDFEKLKKANESKQPRDKIVILRTALIPIKNIVKITVDALLSSDDIFTTKDLDLLIQEAYPTKKRNKHPYAPFLKVLYSSVYKGKELQFDNMLVVKDRVMRGKKRFYDVLRFKEDFDPKTTKEFIKQESERLEKVRLDELSEQATKKYGFEVVYES
jgi:hypothetical protein